MRGRVLLPTVAGVMAVATLGALALSEGARTVAFQLGSGASVARDPGQGARRLVLDTSPRRVADLYTPRARTGQEAPPLLVLVHGSDADGRRDPLTRLLARQLSAEGFPVLTLDLRGFGESEDPPAPLAQHLRFGQDVARAARHALSTGLAGNGRVVYVGHSLGASVVLKAAAYAPRPAAVVALGTPSMEDRLRDGGVFARERLRDMEHPTDRASVEAMERYLRELDPEALRARGVPVPARFVFGEHETAGRTLPAWGDPHDVVVIPEAGHRYGIDEGPWGLAFYDRRTLRAVTAAIGEWAENWGG